MRAEADNGLPQTILHVIDALNYGGAQKLLVLLAQWTLKGFIGRSYVLCRKTKN